MKVVLIDDEQNCLEMLTLFIDRYCPMLEIAGHFDDPILAAERLPVLRPDLVFLDVEMPGLNGFALLDRCRDLPFHVIFTTAFNQYALRAIKYSALDYLLKPIDKSELIAALQKMRPNHGQKWLPEQRGILLDYVHPVRPVREKIALPTADGLVFLELKDIVSCESEGNYTRLFLLNGQSPLFTKPLKEIEEMLAGGAFFRVHHSFLVNLKQVAQYVKSDGGELVLTNGQRVPVSRQKKQELLLLLAHL